ncbi:MAG TPA: hypothetical protein VGB77_05275 [Abditibacteriaceae bacterium]|jgi:SOS response regulatory protein OraA/RecX
MSFDLSAILRSKSELRQKLAARPIKEKLAMLDTLRERTVALRSAASSKCVLVSRFGEHAALESK